MTPFRLVHRRQTLRGESPSLPGFEISWAGGSGWDGGYCFGSDDGRVRFSTEKNASLVAESGEAINGVAFLGDVMAVSTRAEVVFCRFREEGVEFSPRPGGAHGIISTPSGKFIAPLGPNGLLEATVTPGGVLPRRIVGAGARDLVFYKVAVVGAHAGRAVLVSALRHRGWASWVQDGSSGFAVASSPGLDAVDICPLRSERFPRAAVILGIDNSLHIIEDATARGPVKVLRLDEFRGAAYRLLAGSEGMLLLTSESLYHLGDLIDRCLDGERVDQSTTVWGIDLEAVDASVAHGRDLLIVWPDGGVTVLDINQMAGETSQGSPLRVTPRAFTESAEWETIEPRSPAA